MDACSNVIALSRQCQIAASNTSPHINRQVIAHLVAECIGICWIDIRETRKRKVFVHTRHVSQSGPFRQKLDQGIEGCGFPTPGCGSVGPATVSEAPCSSSSQTRAAVSGSTLSSATICANESCRLDS